MRSDNYKNNFSYEGLHALFEYLEDYEDDIGEEIEFDMVAICCQYSEYDNLDDFNASYGSDYKQYTFDMIEEKAGSIIFIQNTTRFIVEDF